MKPVKSNEKCWIRVPLGPSSQSRFISIPTKPLPIFKYLSSGQDICSRSCSCFGILFPNVVPSHVGWVDEEQPRVEHCWNLVKREQAETDACWKFFEDREIVRGRRKAILDAYEQHSPLKVVVVQDLHEELARGTFFAYSSKVLARCWFNPPSQRVNIRWRPSDEREQRPRSIEKEDNWHSSPETKYFLFRVVCQKIKVLRFSNKYHGDDDGREWRGWMINSWEWNIGNLEQVSEFLPRLWLVIDCRIATCILKAQTTLRNSVLVEIRNN